MRVWKRCVAALLAFVMMFTSVSVGFAAGEIDGKTGVWSASAADIVMEHYGFGSNNLLEQIFDNKAVDSGFEYTAELPYANGAEGKDDLVKVDYLKKMFYANSFESNGLRWVPTSAVLLVEGEEEETFPFLEEKVTYYNDEEEFFTSEEFKYEGKRYTIEVTYSLPLDIDVEEQQRILNAPDHLMKAVKNTDVTLARIRGYLDSFGHEIPTLKKMLTMSLPAKGEKPEEPFFDAEKHAAEIGAIEDLYAEYTKNEEAPKLDLLVLSDELWDSNLSYLACALESGADVQDAATSLYEKMQVLNKSQRLRSLLNQLKTIDIDAHVSLKALYKYMGRLMDPVEELASDDSWKLLDETVQESVFSEEYTPEDVDALSALASALKGYIPPEAVEESIVPVEATVSCEIITHDVNITVTGKSVGGGVGNSELIDLKEHTATIRVLDGATQQELKVAVEGTGIKDHCLSCWKTFDEAYKIGSNVGYQWKESTLKGVLTKDFDYAIKYEPNYYKVERDYASNLKVPFGYQLELPESTEKEGWYDYYVDGEKFPYNQGTVIRVERDLEIRRSGGSAKEEYPLLYFLAEDPNFHMSELQKDILVSPALIGPVLKIRLPGENIGSIEPDGTGYSVRAVGLPSGMLGMRWTVDSAKLYDGEKLVQNLDIVNNKVFWTTTEYTHVIFEHSMEITKVSDGELTEERVREYANLPYTLSAEVGNQQRALSGDDVSSAKSVLAKMENYAIVFNYLKNTKEEDIFEFMSTDAAKNAVRILVGSETEPIEGVKGESLGEGCWSAYDRNKNALHYYLGQCKDADWSVATYYEYGYYTKLAEQALRMADCLQDLVNDPVFVTALTAKVGSSPVQALKNMIPVLREMAGNMKGPNKQFDVKDSSFPILIKNLLAIEGTLEPYDEVPTIRAYWEVPRYNAENFGVMQVTVQKGSLPLLPKIFDYALDTVKDSKRCHVMTAEDVAEVNAFLAEAEAKLGISAVEKQYYYDCLSTGSIPRVGDVLTKKDDTGILRTVTLRYEPKTYTVTIDGVSTDEYKEEFVYGGDYVIELPAKSKDPSDKYYYQYTFLDEKGEVMHVVGAKNGSVGHYTFKEEQLPKLFVNDTYVIYREVCIENGAPTTILKPKLTSQWIRGAEEDSQSKMLFLDANPEGLSYAEFLKQVERTSVNGKLCEFELVDSRGIVLEKDQLVGTGTKIRHVMENVYGKEVKGNLDGYTIIMMGDVNGDGKCEKTDAEAVAETYFYERDKKGEYVDPPSLNFRLAANMNNNKKLDSNDAWLIRSKGLYWDGDQKQSQIVYRTVLR